MGQSADFVESVFGDVSKNLGRSWVSDLFRRTEHTMQRMNPRIRSGAQAKEILSAMGVAVIRYGAHINKPRTSVTKNNVFVFP